jgi:hypothetical protein
LKKGNETFANEQDLLIESADHKLIPLFSTVPGITLPAHIEILGSFSFSACVSHSQVSFESNSRLTRIESDGFSSSLLSSIDIPRSVEVPCESCFSWCRQLSRVTFEPGSRLTRIESDAFSDSSLESVEIPRSVQFIAGSALSGVELS